MAIAAPFLVPVLEAAGTAITGAWTAFVSSGAATAVAGGAATAVILSVPGDTAKNKDKATTDTDVMTRTRERDCKCPADRGTMGPVNHSMPQLSAQYQQYVTGFPRGMEWIYMNKDFDGFQSSQCLLQEAKANYEFFFDNNGKPNFMFLRGKGPKNHGEVKNRPAYERTRDQARGQSDIVRSSPPAKLNWYFMQLKFYTWATAEFAENGYAITTQFKPMNIN